jgi:DNA-binding XRE family transcriptional regulator
MQAGELKAIRNELGWTQQQMADELGMSRKAIVEMETGKASIEARTSLAARQVFNSHARLSASHGVVEMPGDVPLASAQIIWDRADAIDPPVKVVAIPGDDDDRYMSSYGACNKDWIVADDVGRLLRLMTLFVDLTVGDGLPPKAVHAAFSVIPEYRWAMHPVHFNEGVEG